MRYQGKIISWNEARGFGFIQWNGSSDRVFVHVSAFKGLACTPTEGLIVTYAVEKDAQGRFQAVKLSIPASQQGQAAAPLRIRATSSRHTGARGRSRPPARGMRALRKLAVAGLVAAAIMGYQWFQGLDGLARPGGDDGSGSLAEFAQADAPAAARLRGSDAALQAAFEAQRGDLQIEGQGTVIKVLPDDNKGSRHQRFILRLDSGQTVLVAHNIDLAPRIPGLAAGDTVAFFGEYEWNPQGGVIHWTHHDPGGRHVGGWLRHRGQTYE